MVAISRSPFEPVPDSGSDLGLNQRHENRSSLLSLDEQLRVLPPKPGIYLLKDSSARVLYVGKAGNLKNRVKAHFGTSGDISAKERRMQGRITNLEYIVTDSEQQALILECTLIKKYHPRYNVALRDDKTFPYIKIDLREPWPRVNITRRWQKDGARYFGPFASAGSVKETVRLLKRLFPFCSCKREITGKDTRPCLNFHIRRCLGPCIGKVTREQYLDVIGQVIHFLEGRQEIIVRGLKRKMVNASNSHEFERAAWLRDQISSVESVIEGQRLASAVRGDLDAIAIASSGELADVQVFFIRSSRLVGREHFTVDSVEGETCEKVMTSFVKQYYSSAARIPPLVLLEYEIEEKDVILNWLRYERGGQVSIVVPRRGVRRELINVVQENAKHGLEQLKFRLDTDAHAAEVSLNELAEKLSLPLPPKRIECYDISNIHGTNAVGSMVVFEDAMPRRDKYRRFLIKTVPGADDYAMLREIIGRRFRHGSQNGGEWSVVPDLVVVDGGIGQLNAVTAVLQELGTKIPAVGLAKQREEIFLPGQSIPMSLPAYSHSRRLLQRIRDEAHRFAISYHRKLRQKNSVASVLDNIPGIGIRKRRELIRKFGSVKGIRSAGLDELVSVPGINRELAEKIKDSVGNDSKRQLLH